jgi:hypothetical protein
LKDFGRDAGSVSFADIDRDVPGQGYASLIIRRGVAQSCYIASSNICLETMRIAPSENWMVRTFAVGLFALHSMTL